MKNPPFLGVIIYTIFSLSIQTGQAQFVFEANAGGTTATLIEYEGSQLSGALTIPSTGSVYVNGAYATLPVTAIGVQALENQRFITSVVIPNTVTSIEQGAFGLCYELSSVSFPNSVTSIGEEAFQNCALSSITLPNSVASIGGDAFGGNAGLSSALFQGNAPSYSDDPNTVFAGDPTTVYYFPGTTGWETTFDGDPAVMLLPEPNSLVLLSIGIPFFLYCYQRSRCKVL